MEKVLSQEEIDAMVRAARGGKDATSSSPAVSLWDARQAGQIGRDQLQMINTLHEGFARDLTNSLAAYLRISFTAALVSAEHLTFGEFLRRIPEVTYLSSIQLKPMDATALLQLDLTAAFPLIDVLLGGEGKSGLPERQMTEIEEQIVETVVRIVCRELQKAWQVLALQFEFEQRMRNDHVQRLMPPKEKILSLSFELCIAESRGTLNLVFPAAISNALLRKLAAGFVREKRAASPDSLRRLSQRLLNCGFPATCEVQSRGVPLRSLMQLAPGTLLPLRQDAQSHAIVRVGEKDLFFGKVARVGSVRVAQIVERSSSSRIKG